MMTFNNIIFNTKIWVLETDPPILKEKLGSCLQASAHGIRNFVEHFFQPVGYTAVWLLSESHLAVHTFPERGSSYIELSSCSPSKVKAFVNAFRDCRLHILQISEDK